MMKRRFGCTGVEVSVIGQGTWLIENGGGGSLLAIESLQLGIELGMTHIDTAEMYGNGRAEELVGQVIAGKRDEIFLVSKVLPSNASYEGTIRSCRQSLKRLNTDYLDLYLLHWPSSSYSISETMKAMEKLASDGMIRHIGVSNFGVEELKEAEKALRNERISCNQVLHHLGYRGIEKSILPYCAKQQIAVVGYSPFGHVGSLFSTSSQNKGGRLQLLGEIAKRHGKTPRQVALNFLTSRHPNVFTIPKTSNPDHVRENSESVGWGLAEDDVKSIDEAFPVPDHDVPLEMM